MGRAVRPRGRAARRLRWRRRGRRDPRARWTIGRTEADPHQRRGAPEQRAGRGPADGRLCARGDAPRRRCPRPAPRGPRRPGSPALPGLCRRPLDLRPSADPAQPSPPGDSRGAGVPRPAAILGREAGGVRGRRPGRPARPAGRALRPTGRRPRRDRSRGGPAGPVVRHERPGHGRRDARLPRWPDACARPPRRSSGTARPSSAPTGTTSPSRSTAASSPPSPRGASSGRRSWPSSSPSWTSSPRSTARRPSSCSTTSSPSSTRPVGRTSSGGSPRCPRPS